MTCSASPTSKRSGITQAFSERSEFSTSDVAREDHTTGMAPNAVLARMGCKRQPCDADSEPTAPSIATASLSRLAGAGLVGSDLRAPLARFLRRQPHGHSRTAGQNTCEDGANAARAAAGAPRLYHWTTEPRPLRAIAARHRRAHTALARTRATSSMLMVVSLRPASKRLPSTHTSVTLLNTHATQSQRC